MRPFRAGCCIVCRK